MPKLPSSLTETFTFEPHTNGTHFLRIRWPKQMPKIPFSRWGHGMVLLWVLLGTGLSGWQPPPVLFLEQKMQGWFQQLRGSTVPPQNVVILAIDDESVNYLGQAPPLPRSIYAQVVNRLMGSGARAIAFDLKFANRSSFGVSTALSAAERSTLSNCVQPIENLSEDDRVFLEALQRYGDRVVIATSFRSSEQRQAEQTQLQLPYCPFQKTAIHFGNIDFSYDRTYRISQFGSQYFATLRREQPEQAEAIEEVKLLSFADAALQAAQLPYAPPAGSTIFFYDAPGQAFQDATIPLWHLLDDENWKSDRLQQGKYFKDKLVIVGATAAASPDKLQTPVGLMNGVELHAHAIATLLEGRSLQEGLPNPWLRGLGVGVGLLAIVWVQSRVLRPILRLTWAGVGLVGWNSFSYALFNMGGLLLPTALPMTTIGLTGLSYWMHGLIDRRNQQRQLEAAQSRTEPEPAPLNLQQRQLELQGKELGGRYRIIQILGSGGFGETYVAEDLQRPQAPRCVVKQLRPQSRDPRHLKLASRLFKREAEALEKLGSHEQIPRLLAYFEEDEEFYLVQEFITGRPLSEEFTLGRQLPEAKVLAILRDLLQILNFVHSQGVIHRDIKPSNIIQKDKNSGLVLIDFGAVKALQDSLVDSDRVSDLTIGIGTQGYMAPEQCAGQPRLNSDLYAVGMVGIQALTGMPPSQLKPNPDTGEVEWLEYTQVSAGLAQILTRLVRYDFKTRYQKASEVIQDLQPLSLFPTSPELIERAVQEAPLVSEVVDHPTQPWPTSFGSVGTVLPPEPPPTQPSPLSAPQELPVAQSESDEPTIALPLPVTEPNTSALPPLNRPHSESRSAHQT
ncbi:MAG: serine/threonine-protein kinase [Synechococcales bacterium]|nr:serine/threonine-protein kinase [Synechococcales bacterium]